MNRTRRWSVAGLFIFSAARYLYLALSVASIPEEASIWGNWLSCVGKRMHAVSDVFFWGPILMATAILLWPYRFKMRKWHQNEPEIDVQRLAPILDVENRPKP